MIEHRNPHGVLLRYTPELRRPHHDQLKFQPSDRLRCGVVKCEREIFYIRVMLERLEDALSATAVDRFELSLKTLEALLNLVRDELDLGDGDLHGQ